MCFILYFVYDFNNNNNNNHTVRRLDNENVKFRKYNTADGSHSENRYSSICQPRIVRIWRNLVRRRKFWTRRRKRDKNSEIPKFMMADGHHIENHYLAITWLHIYRLRQNLEWWGIIARTRRLDNENVKFRKSSMADGRHFENHYISISQLRIVRIWRNLVRRRKFWVRRWTWQKFRNSQIQDGWRTPYLKSFFGYNSAPYCPIKTKIGMRRHNRTHTTVKWWKC